MFTSEEDKKSIKDEKKPTTRTGKDLSAQKRDNDTVAPPRSPRSGSGRRGAGFKPGLPAMTATPDMFGDDDDDNEVDGTETKIPEGLYSQWSESSNINC